MSGGHSGAAPAGGDHEPHSADQEPRIEPAADHEPTADHEPAADHERAHDVVPAAPAAKSTSLVS